MIHLSLTVLVKAFTANKSLLCNSDLFSKCLKFIGNLWLESMAIELYYLMSAEPVYSLQHLIADRDGKKKIT